MSRIQSMVLGERRFMRCHVDGQTYVVQRRTLFGWQMEPIATEGMVAPTARLFDAEEIEMLLFGKPGTEQAELLRKLEAEGHDPRCVEEATAAWNCVLGCPVLLALQIELPLGAEAPELAGGAPALVRAWERGGKRSAKPSVPAHRYGVGHEPKPRRIREELVPGASADQRIAELRLVHGRDLRIAGRAKAKRARFTGAKALLTVSYPEAT